MRSAGNFPLWRRCRAGGAWLGIGALVIVTALGPLACDRSAALEQLRSADAANVERALFPAVFLPPAADDGSRCAPAAGAESVPSWLRGAVESPGCSDELVAALSVFSATPVTDDAALTPAAAQDLLSGAAFCDAADIIERLLARPVDVNGRDACSGTALVAAASSGTQRVVGRLLEAGAAVNVAAGHGRWERTALLEAAIRADADLIRVLLGAGADPNASTLGGRTPLMFAATTKGLPLLMLLLRAGADPCRRDEAGLDAGRIAHVHNLLVESALLAERAASCGAQTGTALPAENSR